ncbi:hypothetical protein GJ744_007161 [Endocarpon pusillum]|uniref:Uncharacterized protein n=1 Tax=Endocarpon pusillum TaxID=364733 RepID=A0A8H7E5H1_9EURO|nr:hypothetical protein GJ744_007161 [Endocarpon pusillum]
MQSQAYSTGHGALHPNSNGQKNGSTKVASTASSSEDEAEQNSSGKRKRPMSVSYAVYVSMNSTGLTAL